MGSSGLDSKLQVLWVMKLFKSNSVSALRHPWPAALLTKELKLKVCCSMAVADGVALLLLLYTNALTENIELHYRFTFSTVTHNQHRPLGQP